MRQHPLALRKELGEVLKNIPCAGAVNSIPCYQTAGFLAPGLVIGAVITKIPHNMRVGTFCEFFAGGGMTRAGLGAKWACLFANDSDRKKCKSYVANWGSDEIVCGDIRALTTAQLPGQMDLAWASFPCQDLSLAGAGAGLGGERSGTFWPFWGLMKSLVKEKRAPEIIVLENVAGTLTSHGGKDFSAICASMNDGGYRFGALVIDAALFTPQSRPRLFIIAVRKTLKIPDRLLGDGPDGIWHTKSLVRAFGALQQKEKAGWLWWRMAKPGERDVRFCDIIEENPESASWRTSAETGRLLAMMSDANIKKVHDAMRSGYRTVGAVYKRTRKDQDGAKVQRAEVRFDDVAGCLRTPAGGSSRQIILVVEGQKVRSRLISSRETARLMGLPDSYRLPDKYNEAYHLTGDGVVVPVVRHLAEQILEPIILNQTRSAGTAA